MTIYNEIEPYAAKWIGNLVAADHVAPGVVDTRSIRDLKAEDVIDHEQAHFFAGIGIWSHALRSAGWADDRPVWTGSCPCQPFSTAGRAKGFDDERHLWPEWFRLIRECRPSVILGEQVASPDGLRWLDLVSSDLEGAGYAFGAADLCAAGVGAPHIRQRLYFVAVANGQRLEGLGVQLLAGEPRSSVFETRGSGSPDRELAYAGGNERGQGRRCAPVQGQPVSRGEEEQPTGRRDDVRLMGPADDARSQERQGPAIGRGAVRLEGQATVASSTSGFWSPVQWVPCQDGRYRPVEPGTFPLAHGVANRVGKLRAYGNALCAPVATSFVRAVMASLESP